MLGAAVVQLRVIASLAFGLPFAPWALERLVRAAVATYHEFGPLGPDGAELVSGPPLDEDTRRDIQWRRFCQQARRAAGETSYYARLFATLDLNPDRLDEADIARLPLTPGDALRADPDAFVRRGARPSLRVLTTGTTGRPAAIAFAAVEFEALAALTALGYLASGLIAPDDVVVMAVNSRGIGALTLLASCRRLGVLCCPVGPLGPEALLAFLAMPIAIPGQKRRPSVLQIYPSSLGELVDAGRQAGYQPADFGLERILTGGEIVTAGLRRRLTALFGEVAIIDSYGMTETFGLPGETCAAGHLHWHPTHGLVEVLDPATGHPVAPGEAGTLVATPFPPFRDTTLLLRYDTGDVVRRLPADPTCSLRHLPATGPVLGKRRLAVCHAGGWTYPRDVIEALEALDVVPLPARCGIIDGPGGIAVEALVRQDSPDSRRAVAASLAAHGVPVREVRLVTDKRDLRRPLPLRCDLREGPTGALTPAGEAALSPMEL